MTFFESLTRTCLEYIESISMRDTVASLVTRRQNLTRKEFKRILESEAHPFKLFLDKAVGHGHNLRFCKINPVHFRIPVSRTVRHKQ